MSGDNGDIKKEEAKEKMLANTVSRLNYIVKRIKELEPIKNDDPSGREGGKVRKELVDLYNEKIKLETNPAQEAPKEAPKEEAKDFKIAEIWVKEGQLILDASPEFWSDKLRALGVLDMCKDIVKNFKKEQPKIVTGDMVNKFKRVKNRMGGMFGGKK